MHHQYKRVHRRRSWGLAFLTVALFLSSTDLSAFPEQFTYQGSLKQNGVPLNGTYPMEFRITNSDGSQTYWTSGVQNINIREGLYRVDLSPINVNWDGVEPFIQFSVNGNVLLPREKLTATPYAWMAKDLGVDAVAQGNLSVTGKLGIGTINPIPKLHVVDSNQANSQDEFTYQAESNPPGYPYQMRFGYRGNIPALQSTQEGIGGNKLSLNPDGGNVGIGIQDPLATFTIYKHGLQGAGVTNTLIAAGFNTYYIDGGRQFLVQQWFNSTSARTFVIGNGFVSGDAYPLPNNAPTTKFQGIEFGESRFGFIWNNAGSIAPALIVDPSNGKVGIGTDNPNEKLEVNGTILVRNAVVNEQGKPAFLVSVDIDDCQGYWHPYLGCPQGYWPAGRWHTGPGRCDYQLEGWGYENGQLDSGWMVLCVSQ